MKQHLTAIAFNERELESYVAQLKMQSFETVSEVKKADDGTFYQVLAKSVRQDVPLVSTPKTEIEPSLSQAISA